MKQIKIVFETENNRLPANYDSFLLSFIKHAVEQRDKSLFDEWFDQGRNSSTLGKSYTFSCAFPSPKFKDDSIFLGENTFSFFLSTCDVVDLMRLYNAFVGFYRRRERYPAQDNAIWASWIGTSELPGITGSSALIKFDSSLLVRRHDRETNGDKFLSFQDEGFVETIRAAAEAALRRSGRKTPVDSFDFQPVNAKKTVVRYFNDMKVTGNIGTYAISGTPELLNFLLLSGVGSATGSGHGKFRVLNQRTQKGEYDA